MLSQARLILFPKTTVEDVMGNITSMFIQYKCIFKYHYYMFHIFCKDTDKKMNLICFC